MFFSVTFCSMQQEVFLQRVFDYFDNALLHKPTFVADATVPVIITDDVDDGVVDFIAACPPDRRTSFSGSGLPFATPEQALLETPNVGRLSVLSKNTPLSIDIITPNSFYVGSSKVYPTLFIRYKSKKKYCIRAIKLADHIPYRMLFHTPHNAEVNETHTNQELILRKKAYPSSTSRDQCLN